MVPLYLIAGSLSLDRGVLLNMVYPLVAVLLGFTATQAYRIFFEQAQRQLVQDLMSRYLCLRSASGCFNSPNSSSSAEKPGS